MMYYTYAVSMELTSNMIIRHILPIIVNGIGRVCSSYDDAHTKDQEG